MIEIDTLSVAARMAENPQSTYLIDIRREDEVAGITAEGALQIPRDMLELKLQDWGIGTDSTLYLLCQSGARSNYAARALRHFGYDDAWSVQGGFQEWNNQRFSVQRVAYLPVETRNRFARQIALGDLGIEGQARLANANVLLIGAGGLGSPAALYLAAMGVGTLQIIDDDDVELSNLQRQILHNETFVGKPKVDSASATLSRLNSKLAIQTHRCKFDSQSEELVSKADIVINGADNFATRYAANDLCIEHGKPLIDGAVLEMEGQLSVFCYQNGPCYRCLYPQTPPASLAPSCVAAGVLGVVPGIIGTLQALEAVKLITGIGAPLSGKLLSFDARDSTFNTVNFEREIGCGCSMAASADRRTTKGSDQVKSMM